MVTFSQFSIFICFIIIFFYSLFLSHISSLTYYFLFFIFLFNYSPYVEFYRMALTFQMPNETELSGTAGSSHHYYIMTWASSEQSWHHAEGHPMIRSRSQEYSMRRICLWELLSGWVNYVQVVDLAISRPSKKRNPLGSGEDDSAYEDFFGPAYWS